MNILQLMQPNKKSNTRVWLILLWLVDLHRDNFHFYLVLLKSKNALYVMQLVFGFGECQWSVEDETCTVYKLASSKLIIANPSVLLYLQESLWFLVSSITNNDFRLQHVQYVI